MHATVAVFAFLASYTLFVVLPRHRPLVGAAACLLLLAAGVLSLGEMVRAIHWNVMGVFFGTLVVAELFLHSNMPSVLAERLVHRCKNSGMALALICAMSGLLSIAMENVACVLIMAPIALSLARKIGVTPVPLMISIAISSNLQGAATLIGDPPSMLLAAASRPPMTFNDFFFHAEYGYRPSIFWAIQVAAAASLVLLYRMFFRPLKGHVETESHEPLISSVPTAVLGVLVVGLAVSSFIDPGFVWLSGTLSMVLAAVSLAWAHWSPAFSARKTAKGLDWFTTVFLMAVFVIVGGLEHTGVIDRVSDAVAAVLGSHVLLAYVTLIAISVLVSAFVDNVPYLVAMLPIAAQLAHQAGVAQPLFMFALLIGACLGGNITPVGASANIVAIGILRRQGHEVTFRQFMRIGIPFTAVSVLGAATFVWFVWRHA